MNRTRVKTNSGYFLIEAIFYVALLAVFSVAIINAIIIMTKSFRETAIYTNLAGAGAIMERVTREIKQAQSIATIGPTSLKLNTEDSEGAPKTIQFTLSGSNLELRENDIVIGNLNAADILVDSISFTQITTAAGTAIKITLSVHSSHDLLARAADFYGTAILRGAY